MKTIQVYFWSAVMLTAFLTSLPAFSANAAEEIILGNRSFGDAMREAETKIRAYTKFTAQPLMEPMKQRRMNHAIPFSGATREQKCDGSAGADMRADKVMGFANNRVPMSQFKKGPAKKAGQSCSFQFRLDWEPRTARSGRGIGCHINLMICELKYAIQYNASPSNQFCIDDVFVTYQVLRFHDHHIHKMGNARSTYFTHMMAAMKKTSEAGNKKVMRKLDRSFQYKEKHDQWENYKVDTRC